MLKSYEAIYENGQVKWLAEEPSVQSARVIVTVLEETPASILTKRRSPSPSLERREKRPVTGRARSLF